MENGHEQYAKGKVEEKLKQWSKDGKDAAKFDHTWMGLGLLTLPTRHFGWDGITKTMKVVRKMFTNKILNIANNQGIYLTMNSMFIFQLHVYFSGPWENAFLLWQCLLFHYKLQIRLALPNLS